MTDHAISFWNVENLFDVEDSPVRTEKLTRVLKGELEGWTEEVLEQKIAQLASIIQRMHDGHGPDILGVCEVENVRVLDRLVAALSPLGRDYAVAHAESNDRRGIDVAFIFDAGLYEKGPQFQHFVMRRTGTRDVFQVNFMTRAGRDLIVIGNHWPSRGGGQYESEPFRMAAGETLAYFHQRILEIRGRDVAIVAMGDFNDEPFDRSIREYALAIRNRTRIMNAHSVPYFLNLMWEEMGSRDASYYFGSIPNMLDQFFVSRGIVSKASPFAVLEGSVRVDAFEEMVASGDYPRPVRFGRPSRQSSFNRQGFSDHFPISMVLREADAVS